MGIQKNTQTEATQTQLSGVDSLSLGLKGKVFAGANFLANFDFMHSRWEKNTSPQWKHTCRASLEECLATLIF